MWPISRARCARRKKKKKEKFRENENENENHYSHTNAHPLSHIHTQTHTKYLQRLSNKAKKKKSETKSAKNNNTFLSCHALWGKMVTNLLVVFVSIFFISEHFYFVSTIDVVDVIGPDDVCDCKEVDVVSNRDVVLRKHGDVLGRYTKIDVVEGGLPTPSYLHFSGKFFLYYSSQSQVG